MKSAVMSHPLCLPDVREQQLVEFVENLRQRLPRYLERCTCEFLENVIIDAKKLPPKGRSSSRISRKVRSVASNTCRCCMVISSQITTAAKRIMSPKLLSLDIEQTDSAVKPSIGILNVECAVRPPGRRREAMPDDATHSTLRPSPRSWLHRVW